ncbi:MAG TPA: hypothetical protein VF722_04025 [Gemmatimonadaceae bacterium]|jgi:hypothetical protein
MARTLTIQRSIVPMNDRAKFLHSLRAKRAYYASANCRFWVFEEADLAGAFMEFVEANDAQTLEQAQRKAPHQIMDAMRIYREVELD